MISHNDFHEKQSCFLLDLRTISELGANSVFSKTFLGIQLAAFFFSFHFFFFVVAFVGFFASSFYPLHPGYI